MAESRVGACLSYRIDIDNSTFAAITGAAFIAATTGGAQRLETAANATVRRYVRAVTSGTFSNAVFFVHFVRRQIAVTY